MDGKKDAIAAALVYAVQPETLRAMKLDFNAAKAAGGAGTPAPAVMQAGKKAKRAGSQQKPKTKHAPVFIYKVCTCFPRLPGSPA